jgi:hypothetical protein
MKTTNEKTYLNLKKCAKKEENINMKGTKRGYGIKLYFKLMLNKLNIMKGSSFIHTPLGT